MIVETTGWLVQHHHNIRSTKTTHTFPRRFLQISSTRSAAQVFKSRLNGSSIAGTQRPRRFTAWCHANVSISMWYFYAQRTYAAFCQINQDQSKKKHQTGLYIWISRLSNRFSIAWSSVVFKCFLVFVFLLILYLNRSQKKMQIRNRSNWYQSNQCVREINKIFHPSKLGGPL